MVREWKIGDWVEYKGVRMLVFNVDKTYFGSGAFEKLVCRVVDCAGNSDYFSDECITQGRVKHLPACTGWDWQAPKPIVPPEGYRLMTADETIEHGDMFWQGEWKATGLRSITVEQAFVQYGRLEILAYARKIEPQYRQFANAAEFATYFDRKVCYRVAQSVITRALMYTDTGVVIAGSSANQFLSWQKAFASIQFDDGTPFGVLASN